MTHEQDERFSPLYGDPRFPRHGLPGRRVELDEPLSPWARLMLEQGYGKKTNLLYDATKAGWQVAPDSICEPQGNDIDATQMQITLISPFSIPREPDELGPDLQNQTGEFGNDGFLDGSDYPGTASPIRWPSFTAVLRWGTGGARAQAFIDWINGTTINITASAWTLFAAVAPDARNASSPGTSGLYTLAGFSSPGWPRPGNAQRTIHLGSIPDQTESAIVAVPPFAQRVTVIGAIAGAPQVTAGFLRFWQSPDGTEPIGDFFVNGNQPLPFNVPNGGMYFSFLNQTGATGRFALCSELSI